MATVTGLTAERMLEIEAESIVNGTVNGAGHLILTRHDGTTIDSGLIATAINAVDLSSDQSIDGIKTFLKSMVSIGAAAATQDYKSKLAADAFERFSRQIDGKLQWGPGNLAPDVALSRSVANRLQVDGTFQIVSNNVGNTSFVVQQVAAQTANVVALRDSTGANVVIVDVNSKLWAVGSDHYFGPNALNGTAGTRLHLAMTAATAQLIAEGSVANVDLYMTSKGTGILNFLPGGASQLTIDSTGYARFNGKIGINNNSAGTSLSLMTDADATIGLVVKRLAATQTGDLLRITDESNNSFIKATGKGSLAVAAGGGFTTTSTDGFLYVPAGSGPPTGVPTTIAASCVPVYYDKTNNQWYVYNGAWKKTVALT